MSGANFYKNHKFVVRYYVHFLGFEIQFLKYEMDRV
jgi:hypothetical protein